MNFTDLAEFFVMQLGYESLEECYERFVYREPYGLATLNAEIERLRLAAIAGGKESHDAILNHLAAFKPQSPWAKVQALRASEALLQEGARYNPACYKPQSPVGFHQWTQSQSPPTA